MMTGREAIMLRKYFPFLVLGPISNGLWAFWVLPRIGEQGTFRETIQWICVQALIPVLLGILLVMRRKFVFWLLLVYSGFTILFALGILGWALMGAATPISIYLVSAVLLIMGFGVMFNTLSDLKVGNKVTRYETED